MNTTLTSSTETSLRGGVPAAASFDAAAPLAPDTQVARFSSEQLLGGANEVQIEHHGVMYRLRVTALGKLILTK